MRQADRVGSQPGSEGVGEPRPGDADLRREVHATRPPGDVDPDQFLGFRAARLELLDGDGIDNGAGVDDALGGLRVERLERVEAVRPDEDGDTRGPELLPLLEHADVQSLALKRESGGEAARARAHDGHIADVIIVDRRGRGTSGG